MLLFSLAYGHSGTSLQAASVSVNDSIIPPKQSLEWKAFSSSFHFLLFEMFIIKIVRKMILRVSFHLTLSLLSA